MSSTLLYPLNPKFRHYGFKNLIFKYENRDDFDTFLFHENSLFPKNSITTKKTFYLKNKNYYILVEFSEKSFLSDNILNLKHLVYTTKYLPSFLQEFNPFLIYPDLNIEKSDCGDVLTLIILRFVSNETAFFPEEYFFNLILRKVSSKSGFKNLLVAFESKDFFLYSSFKTAYPSEVLLSTHCLIIKDKYYLLFCFKKKIFSSFNFDGAITWRIPSPNKFKFIYSNWLHTY